MAWTRIGCLLLALAAVYTRAAETEMRRFIEKHCAECHDSDTAKGGLDLSVLPLNLANFTNFSKWVLIHDRVVAGEMPPAKKERPPAGEVKDFTQLLSTSLVAAEKSRIEKEGRVTLRRLNRYEYENALRDLLNAPWLQIKDSLPEDGESCRFNKVGDVLDVSHVHMARYLSAADYALRQVIAQQPAQPEKRTVRYYARDQRSFTGPMKFSVFNTAPERATFPVLGFKGQPDVRAGKAPVSVGKTNALLRESEGVGVVAGSYEPIEPKFNEFKAPVAGRYKLRINACSVWVGPSQGNKWFIPDLDNISRGRRSEPITIYSETPPRLLRYLGSFDVTPDPTVKELDVWLLAGETIRPDAARLFRSRPGAGRWQNPLAEKDGQPGVVFRWLEVEGPIYDAWPPAGHSLLFGGLPLVSPKAEGDKRNAEITKVSSSSRPSSVRPGIEIVSKSPLADAESLLRNFMSSAYRRPLAEEEPKRFLRVVEHALSQGNSFADAMIAAYGAVLCSPEFLCLTEKPGRLDDFALASRLAFFLWNSPPDGQLRAAAARGELHRPETLRRETERLLNDPKSRRFVNAFLDYWLDLRKINATSPDGDLYPDYYLDDLLEQSALEETQLFFADLLGQDLPARNIVASDFTFLNERLALHYGLSAPEGVALQRVPLPPGSVRGGLLTHASVLKVTANGTTTSPVLRGVWVLERILGQTVPPPPANTPAIEPDTRGAQTIRQQLDAHRKLESCAVCHVKMDPPGFALENFDVMGGWRERYRALGAGMPDKGIGKNGQKFAFHSALPVDPSGQLPGGQKFSNIRELKRLLLQDEQQIARNLTRQLTIYATGAPIRFADRPHIEQILSRARESGYGVRGLVHEIVQSDLFLNK